MRPWSCSECPHCIDVKMKNRNRVCRLTPRENGKKGFKIVPRGMRVAKFCPWPLHGEDPAERKEDE